MASRRSTPELDQNHIDQSYLDAMGKVPLLSPEDEKELGRRVSEGGPDAELAKQALVRANLRLVVTTAREYGYRGVPLPDLIQEGNLGLMKAATKFDHTRGTRFSTYAKYWIRQGIIRYIENTVRFIRLPIARAELLNHLYYYQTEFSREHGRKPTLEEMAIVLGVSPKTLITVLNCNQNPMSLDAPSGDDGEDDGPTLHKALKNPNPDAEVTLTQKERGYLVEQIMLSAGLDERERFIVNRRFGRGGDEEETLECIGRELGVTRERIRQIEVKALRRLRKAAKAPHLKQER